MSNDESLDDIESRANELISEFSQQTNLGRDIDDIEGIGGEIEEVDQIGNLVITGEGDIRRKDLIQSVNKRFLPVPIHRLSLDAIQELPVYLSDTVISKDLPIGLVGPDHYSFWAWTAAVVSFVQEEYAITGGDPQEFESPFEDFNNVLQDYYSLVHLILSPIRHQGLDSRTKVYFSSMNPSVGKLNEKQVLRFAGNNGFRLFEGLVRRHSNEIELDGTISEESAPVEKQWDTIEGREVPLHSDPNDFLDYEDEIHIWQHYSAQSEAVRDTLNKINDMDRNVFATEDILRKLGKDERTKQEINKQANFTKNFFDVLAKKRNYTLHGRGSTQISGVLILNLCSLIFWDAMNNSDYDEIRDTLLTRKLEMHVRSPQTNMIQQSATAEMSSRMPTIQPDSFDRQEPTDFYPLYPFQGREIMAQMQQRMNE